MVTTSTCLCICIPITPAPRSPPEQTQCAEAGAHFRGEVGLNPDEPQREQFGGLSFVKVSARSAEDGEDPGPHVFSDKINCVAQRFKGFTQNVRASKRQRRVDFDGSAFNIDHRMLLK
jgi:hypothetical protein